MAAFCLKPELVKKFIEALKSGKIDVDKMIEMTSEQRRTYLKDIVGIENAKAVNALFESKLLLKNQQAGIINWIKKTANLSEPIRRDILSRIEKMDKVLDPKAKSLFLEDLASAKLKIDVSFSEAKDIVDKVKEINNAKSKISESSPTGSKERLDYGLKYTLFQEYLQGLKGRGKEISLKELLKPSKAFETISGTTKSILSSLDNSFFGRQGIKALYTHPTIWAKAFIKSWGDIGKELKGVDAMTPIKADIYSRENALNGKYGKMKLDIGIDSEEAFPSNLPEKIPLFGRLFKASESAFNGAALRIRADLADKIITSAEKQGVDFTQKGQAEGIGQLINSMTGRGKVSLTPGQSKFINNAFFSIKFLKSNFDTLTMHRLGFAIEKGEARTFVRKEAAKNLAKIVATTAAVLFTAEQLQPGSTKKNPGFITIGETRFDLSGGLASIAVLAYKVAQKMMDKNVPKYGASTGMDLLNNFWEGKLSPVAGAIRDVVKGQDFQGKKPTAGSTALNLITPLPISTYQDLQNPKAAPTLASMILDMLGISTYTPPVRKK